MQKYELYVLTDQSGNETRVMEVKEQMTEDEIDIVCDKWGIDVVKGID